MKHLLWMRSLFVLAIAIAGQPPTLAAPSPIPRYDSVIEYTTEIDTNGDIADIYFPLPTWRSGKPEQFAIALLLPGANVDKSAYSNFATTVASYGFVVIVPNHPRSIPQFDVEGLLAQAAQIPAILDYAKAQNTDPASPISGLLDTDTLVLLGHSHGGAVGMTAMEDACVFPFCEGEFHRPDALVAGVFFGTHRQDLQTGEYDTTENDGLPIALIRGSLDGVATPEEVETTYDSIQQPPKALITVAGANHYSITDENNPDRAKNAPTLDQSIATETIARWSALFLRAHALDDEAAYRYIYHTGDAADDNVRIRAQPQSPMSQFPPLLLHSGLRSN